MNDTRSSVNIIPGENIYSDDVLMTTPNLKTTDIFIDNSIVGGVVNFDTSVSVTADKTISEYLSSSPYAVVSGETTYKVTLKLLGNNKVYSGMFNLDICGEDYKITYKNCTVLSDRYYSEDATVYRNIVLGCGERVFYGG